MLSRHSGAMRSIESGIHNPHSWLWISGLRQVAHPGMTAAGVLPGVIACDKRDTFAHGSASDEAIQLSSSRRYGLLR